MCAAALVALKTAFTPFTPLPLAAQRPEPFTSAGQQSLSCNNNDTCCHPFICSCLQPRSRQCPVSQSPTQGLPGTCNTLWPDRDVSSRIILVVRSQSQPYQPVLTVLVFCWCFCFIGADVECHGFFVFIFVFDNHSPINWPVSWCQMAFSGTRKKH